MLASIDIGETAGACQRPNDVLRTAANSQRSGTVCSHPRPTTSSPSASAAPRTSRAGTGRHDAARTATAIAAPAVNIAPAAETS